MILRQELTRAEALNDTLYLSLPVAMGGSGLCCILLCLLISCVLEVAGQENYGTCSAGMLAQSLDLRGRSEPGRGVPTPAHHSPYPG